MAVLGSQKLPNHPSCTQPCPNHEDITTFVDDCYVDTLSVDLDERYRKANEVSLLRYCELDTLAIVGGNAKRHAPNQARRKVLITESGIDRRNGKGSSDVEARETIMGSESRAPIKMVDGRPWSPGVNRSLRLLGKTLEVAWARAFIRTSQF